MKTEFNKLPAGVEIIMRKLVAAGYEAYVVGGAVRDLVLKRTPKDFDITTNARPDQIAELFPASDLVGAHFGVTLVYLNNVAFEVATYRTDGSYSDHRRPDFVGLTTDVKEDLKRRDFTINALLMTVDGELFDYVGGLEDLATGTVRAIGSPGERFTEDPARMLRMVRLAAQLGFSIDYKTAALAGRLASLLEYVAVERVAKELNGILLSGNAPYGMELLHRLNMMPVVLPEVNSERMEATDQSLPYHPEGNVWTHTKLLLKHMHPPQTAQVFPGAALEVALAALLHDTGKPDTQLVKPNGRISFKGHEKISADNARKMLTRLRYPRELAANVVNLVEDHMRIGVLSEMRTAKQLRFIRKANFHQQLELHRLDAVAANGDLTSYKYALTLLVHTPEEKLKPQRLVTGHDLIAKGLLPGPGFKGVLEAIEDWQLEGHITTKAQALAYVDEWIEVGKEMEFSARKWRKLQEVEDNA